MVIRNCVRRMKVVPFYSNTNIRNDGCTSSCCWIQSFMKRGYSTTTTIRRSNDDMKMIVSEMNTNDTMIRVIGKKYTDTRQYVLLPSHLTIPSSFKQREQEETFYKETNIVSLYANRNIIFGAQIGSHYIHQLNEDDNQQKLIELALPLVKVALQNASIEGEQPQALSTLNGLSSWVRSCLQSQEKESSTIQQLQQDTSSRVALEAITAIATGTPRPGHSVVGIGTYRDGKDTWEQLAKEYCLQEGGESFESSLYQQAGGQIIQMEYLADKRESYLQQAGGTMARFLFW